MFPFSPLAVTMQFPSGDQLRRRKKVLEAAAIYGSDISFSTTQSDTRHIFVVLSSL